MPSTSPSLFRRASALRAGAGLMLCAGLLGLPRPAQSVFAVPPQSILVGQGTGGRPHVKVFDGNTGAALHRLSVFPSDSRQGIRIAVGDLTGDGTPDLIAGRGNGSTPHVKVFDGRTLTAPEDSVNRVTAFEGEIRRGVNVAVGDVDGDGRAEVIAGAAGGTEPLVQVLDSLTGETLLEIPAYPRGFKGGVYVGAGDLDGDGKAEIVVGPGAGTGPEVKVFDGQTGALITSFSAYRQRYSGGVRVAVGDVNGDGVAEVVTGPGNGIEANIRVFADSTPSPRDPILLARTGEFAAFDPTFKGGVSVAVANLDTDAEKEIIIGASSGKPLVRTFQPDGTPGASFLAFEASFRGGVFVAGF